jgi:hypothetical protein
LKRIADGEYPLRHFQLRGITPRHRRQVCCVDLQHGDVGGWIGADDLGAQLALVGHRDRHLDALIDDVVVREHVAI